MKTMKTMTTLTLVTLSLATFASADVGLTVDSAGVKADVGVASVSQRHPSLKVGPAANSNAIFDLSFKGGINVTLPFISLSVPLGSATVGTKAVGVAAGQDNKVNVGGVSVSQSLPAVQIGTLANKAALFDVSLKGGLGLTLPFVSLNVPYPGVASCAEAPSKPVKK